MAWYHSNLVGLPMAAEAGGPQHGGGHQAMARLSLSASV